MKIINHRAFAALLKNPETAELARNAQHLSTMGKHRLVVAVLREAIRMHCEKHFHGSKLAFETTLSTQTQID